MNCLAGVETRGAFTCVEWQVTLCDPIWQWQVTLNSYIAFRCVFDDKLHLLNL